MFLTIISVLAKFYFLTIPNLIYCQFEYCVVQCLINCKYVVLILLIYLVQCTESKINGSKLPSNCQVLRNFFYYHRDLKKTISMSCKAVIDDVLTFWKRAGIPTAHQPYCIKKLKLLHLKWRAVQKSSYKKIKTEIIKRRENDYIKSLGDLFDVAHKNALDIITDQSDKEFLLAQREPGRRGCIRQRHNNNNTCVTNIKCSMSKNEPRNVAIVTSDSDSEDSNEECNDADFTLLQKKSTHKPKISPEIVSAMDRANISDRNAAFIINATVQTLGQPSINRSTLRRHRLKVRSNTANQIREQFKMNKPAVVHWDGKLLPDMVGKEKVERLPVLITADGIEKLLGVAKLHSGTGKAQADAVVDLLRQWNIVEHVSGMSFDTTASNTSLKIGACSIIEKTLGRELLWLACRHHIMEIMLSAVFTHCIGDISAGPGILLFKRFQKAWPNIVKTKFNTGKLCNTEIGRVTPEIISFCKTQLEVINIETKC